MNSQIADKIRVALGKKYLDWAEKLPKFGGGIIASLQRIRESQRVRSEEVYERSRPPQDCEIELLYFRLMEVFHIEEAGHLLKNLLRLFPNLEDEAVLGGKSFRDAFNYQTGRIGGSAYWNLGFIGREAKGRVFAGRFREMKELPREVDYIHVYLYKVLPSMFVVTLDVHLTDKGSQHLTHLQNRRYLSEIRFKKLIPRGPFFGGGYSDTGPERIVQRTLLHWLKHLRGEVEKCIKPFISGHFMQWSSDKIARLPAIEVYALKGFPEGESPSDWMRNARWWWESFGFTSVGYDTYSDGKVLFMPKNLLLGTSYRVTHRLVVLWEHYIGTVDKAGYIDEKSAVTHRTQDTLTALLDGIVLQEILDGLQSKFEQLRQKVFGRMKSTWFSKIRFSAHIKLNDVVLRTSMLLDRISTEFKQRKEWILRDMQGISELRSVKNFKNKEPRKLSDVLVGSIDFRAELLDKHVSFVRKWFSQYLNLRNTQVTCIFAIIAGVIGVIGVALAWLALKP